MTQLLATRVVRLSDAAGRDLGTLAIEEVRGDLVLGDFTPGADYAAVEAVFGYYSDVIEQQSFSFLDEAEAAVRRVGVTAEVPGRGFVAAHDVQIYRDGGTSFRLPADAARNGSHPPA